MRRMWLKKEDTGAIWDVMPQNPYLTEGGCFFAHPEGLGYEQDISQKQVNVDYFINEIKSKNHSISVEAYFNGNQHLANFVDFIGDFSEQFNLYYSPDGSIDPDDQISKPYYKPVVISNFERGEMNSAGFIVCKISFTSQSDVWKKDYVYSVQTSESVATMEQLQYPYVYPYTFEGDNLVAIIIENNGRETGCEITIKNLSSSARITNPGWAVERTIVDKYGNEIKEVQKGVFYVSLGENDAVYVNSMDTAQEAKYIHSDNSSESIVSLQEPSWDYINFVRLKHGTNRFILNIPNIDALVSIGYSELKEII